MSLVSYLWAETIDADMWCVIMTALCCLINFLRSGNIYIPLLVVIELFIIVV